MNALPDSLLDQVSGILKEAADTAVTPRFRALREGDVVEKAKNELVTIADREAERLIEGRLAALLPRSRVIGEEATSADPSLLDGIDEGLVWLVDPLDGTANFVAGRPLFATMAALLQDGVAVGAWVFNPVSGEQWVARLGGGTFCNGLRMHASPPARPAADMRGAVLTGFLPPEVRAQIESRQHQVAVCLPGLRCAGVEYPAIIRDEQQFAVFWRTLPWDHVPGALLLSEAGGFVGRWDGVPYHAGDAVKGLLAAGSVDAWREVQQALLVRP